MWAVAITVLSVIPYQDNDLIVQDDLFSSSRAEMHLIAFLIGALLCYYSYGRNNIPSTLFSSFFIILFGTILETIQILLPYRTFNPFDIVANASGVVLFVLIWAIYSHFYKRKQSPDYTNYDR
jgi:glycopeptide antibiotics resistance protein